MVKFFGNDSTWLEALRSGDEDAFRLLVDRFQDKVFRTCLGLVNDREDADDLTQEVFIEAFRSIRTFRAESGLSTWLCRIAINKSLNFVRSAKRKMIFQSLGLIQVPDVPDKAVNFDADHDLDGQKQQKRMIWAAVKSLPEKQKAAFVLHKIAELSYAEIAQTLKISLPAVESLIFRAKRNLQKRLSRDMLRE
jgi:RNA polymerase sigma factor (sigma-70 family)